MESDTDSTDVVFILENLFQSHMNSSDISRRFIIETNLQNEDLDISNVSLVGKCGLLGFDKQI